MEFKIILLTYKAFNGQAPSYLKDLPLRYFPNRALCSQTSGLFVVPRVSKSRGRGRAFSYQAPLSGTSCHYMSGKQTPSLTLGLGLKLSFVMKFIVKDGSGDPETSHSCYRPRQLGGLICHTFPHFARFFSPRLISHKTLRTFGHYCCY